MRIEFFLFIYLRIGLEDTFLVFRSKVRIFIRTKWIIIIIKLITNLIISRYEWIAIMEI